MNDISIRQLAKAQQASTVEGIAQKLGRMRPPPAISVRELARCSLNASWKNYPQTVSLVPNSICVPESLEDLIAIIQNAEARGKRVHAFGSRWSFSECAVTTDCMVDTTHLNRPIQTVQKAMIRGDPTHVVHVEAGITIKDLYTGLGTSNPSLALETQGGSSGQTLAGAISTGTHGGDKFLPPLADSVMAIHLVGAGGTQYWIEPSTGITDPALIRQFAAPGIDAKKIIYDDNTFWAAVVSLGCMGVIYAVVLRVRPQYDLIETTTATTWERFLHSASAYLNDPDKIPAGSRRSLSDSEQQYQPAR